MGALAPRHAHLPRHPERGPVRPLVVSPRARERAGPLRAALARDLVRHLPDDGRLVQRLPYRAPSRARAGARALRRDLHHVVSRRAVRHVRPHPRGCARRLPPAHDVSARRHPRPEVPRAGALDGSGPPGDRRGPRRESGKDQRGAREDERRAHPRARSRSHPLPEFLRPRPRLLPGPGHRVRAGRTGVSQRRRVVRRARRGRADVRILRADHAGDARDGNRRRDRRELHVPQGGSPLDRGARHRARGRLS